MGYIELLNTENTTDNTKHVQLFVCDFFLLMIIIIIIILLYLLCPERVLLCLQQKQQKTMRIQN